MTENLETDSQMNNQIPPESQDFLQEQLPNDTANTSPGLPQNQSLGNEPVARLESLTNPDPAENPLQSQTVLQAKKESNHLLFILIIIILILVLVVVGILTYSAYINRTTNTNTSITPTPTTTVTATSTSTPTSTISVSATPTLSGETFDNQYMKLIVPTGWTKTTPMNGAINLTKNNYILYINPYFQQSSGVQGGRFSDISSGAPSADAVIKTQPSNPCGTYDSSNIKTMKEYDYYVSNTETNSNCNKPSSGSVWYFSYVTKQSGYINYYSTDPNYGYVITMSYNSRDITKLPKKDDATLKDMLSQMQEIIKTLELKKS